MKPDPLQNDIPVGIAEDLFFDHIAPVETRVSQLMDRDARFN